MLHIRCKQCGKELKTSKKLQSCGCSNMMTLVGNKITALDLSEVVLIDRTDCIDKKSSFTPQELEFQESRSKRKIRKLNFDIR